MDVAAKSTVVKKETEDELNFNVLASQNIVIKEELTTETENQDDNRMDVDPTPVRGEKTEDPVRIKIETINENLVRLTVDGIPESPDDENIILTYEETCKYLEDKISEYMEDPEVNPLLALTNRSLELEEEMKVKNEEFIKINKLFEKMYQNQVKFLRHMQILPKIPTNSVGTSMDFPYLSQSNNTQESLLKKNVNAQKTPAASPLTSGAEEPPKPAESEKQPAPTPSTSKVEYECIDLTDETDSSTIFNSNSANGAVVQKHPAPLPPTPFCVQNSSLPSVPPKPLLKVRAEERGIVLQWEMSSNITPQNQYAKPCAFDIFMYREQENMPINTLLWKKIGSVKAMALPMACTLTQFMEGNKYHFSIRSIDVHNRYGCYSDPASIVYTTRKKSTSH